MTRSVASATETDAALIASARAGDVASYGFLVARHQSVAHRTAYLLGAGDDTPDVVQEAFVKAYLALDRFRVEEPFRPWLLTIVANETRNRWRRTSRHRTVPLTLLGEDASRSVDPSPEQVAEDAETSRALRDAVAALPARQREVVVCRYLLDMAEHDTAQVLGIPPGTVKSRLSRGLRALQTALAGLTPAPPADRERSDD